VAQELLEQAGLVVTIAENGQEAIDAVRRQAFDGALMDIQMPVMDGFEATRRIRADARFKDLPIIAMTANAMAGDREKSLAAGMNAHVAKPIDLEELFETLNRWIRVEKKSASGAEKAESERQPVFDREAGSQRVKGNAELYRKILDRFRTTQEAIPERIRQALDAGEDETAARLIHALKNIAGNIGAFELSAAVGRLETALLDDREDSCNALEAVRQALARVFVAIDEHDGNSAAGASSENRDAIDRTALATLFNRLRTLLRENDAEASETMQAITEQLRGSEHESALGRLAELVGRYDFEKALEEADVVARRLKLPVESGSDVAVPPYRQQ